MDQSRLLVRILLLVFLVAFVAACTTLQTVSKLDASGDRVNLVCVAEHKAVRETVLEVLKEGLDRHGVKYRVIEGSYVQKDKLWLPAFKSEDATGCDAMLFYVANWNWDLAWYMRFANIWMTTPDRTKRLGSATYDARASLNKFIVARDKLLELMDGLFEQYKLSMERLRIQPDNLAWAFSQ